MSLKNSKQAILYGYCRISRPQQSIARQIRNIKALYPNAIIIQEAYTGAKMDRPEWNKLMKVIKTGDTIIFDSVSRMSRTAEEGVKTYFELYNNDVELVFIKEPYINTSTYKESLKRQIELTGRDEDLLFIGINKYLLRLAERQIQLAFEQSEKEVQDLRQRTREGILTARMNGKQIGRPKGKYTYKKEYDAKEKILKYSKSFNGTLTDIECKKLIGISHVTFYKYKKELSLKSNTKNSEPM